MSSKFATIYKELYKTTRFLWVAIIASLAIALLSNSQEDISNSNINQKKVLQKIEKVQAKMLTDIETLEELLQGSDLNYLISNNDTFIEELATRKGYSLYIFENDSLVLWSDNSIPIISSYEANEFKESLLFISNTWGLCRLSQQENFSIVGLIHLQRNYPYENDFLSNDFILGPFSYADFEVAEVNGDDSYTIKSKEGVELFSLVPVDTDKPVSGKDITLIILSIILVLAVLLLLQDLIIWGSNRKMTNWWLWGLAADLFLIRWLMIKFQIPGPLYSTDFFTPFEQGFFFFTSQGDLLITGLFIFLLAFQFKRIFNLYPKGITEEGNSTNPRLIDSFTILGWLIVLIGFFGMSWLLDNVLSERQGLIKVYDVLTINISGLTDLFFFILILASFSFLVRSIIDQIVPQYKISRLILILLVSFVLIIVFSRLWGFVPWPAGLFLLILLVGIFSFSRIKERKRLNHSSSVLIVIIGSIFLTQLIFRSNQEKEYLVKSQLLENLTNEHDLIAEMLFSEIDQQIIGDERLAELLLNPYIDEDVIQSYLHSNYFGFYWNRYDISANVCDSVNFVDIITENREEPCLNFFNAPIKELGRLLPGTNFYYLDNFDGAINYMSKHSFYNPDSSYVSHLFISLDSRLLPQELGYPDLLISGDVNRQDSLIQGYSYAKYQRGKLVSKAGDYVYSTECNNYPEELNRIVGFPEDGYDHLLLKLNADQTIILSSPTLTLWDHLLSFSYVFVLMYILWLLVSTIYYFPSRLQRQESGLKQRIEIILVGVLLVSFIFVGGGMPYYFVKQYDRSNRNNLAEKTQSVLIELKHKLEMVDGLDSSWGSEDYPSLGDLLVKFSIVFNTDINLFDTNGEVLATSRPEIFDRQLVGRKMDPSAYHEVSVHNQMEFVHFENIGDMKFWSAYVPFYNYENKLIAYLNLPYFAKQSVIRQEISTFIVAILNAYFLLIFLAVMLAVFLSNQVTKPLRLLQEKFAKMELGGINQIVDYRRKDEIGSLVKSYNRMVDQLEISADMLAKSERETAWREMAKQIAHEIKNPLTPMKLSVQHLRRAWDDKAEDWEVYFDRVSQTLVEQINSLSAIADEFAQFARMPQSKLKIFNIEQRVLKSIALFEISESCKIKIIGDTETPIPVYADDEQLKQVFNNLFKNAFQSVPKSRKPNLTVKLWLEENMVIISLRDNGSGIDPEISEKLFQPNFTTKSSGMGLGLAISKRIVENVGGKIWYETEQSKGSTFFISLPVYNKNE